MGSENPTSRLGRLFSSSIERLKLQRRPRLLRSGRWRRAMHTRKPWPMHSAHAAFISWERPSPNGRASRLPTTARSFFCLIHGDADVGVGVRSLERDSPLRILVSGRLPKKGPLWPTPCTPIFLRARRLEIPPGAGNFNFVKHFARRALPLSSPSSPSQQCWPSCRRRGLRASRSSTAVLTLVLSGHALTADSSPNHPPTGRTRRPLTPAACVSSGPMHHDCACTR